MKSIKYILLFAVLALSSIVFSEETITGYFTSGCLGNPSPAPEILLTRTSDSVTISGTLYANCAGTHLAVVQRKNDSILVTTKDTGVLATCLCLYSFRLTLRIAPTDSILSFNLSPYRMSAIPQSLEETTNPPIPLDVLYDPATESIRIGRHPAYNTLSIYDTAGSLQLTLSNDRTVIDLTGFKSGLYLLDFTTMDKKSYKMKVIKSPMR